MVLFFCTVGGISVGGRGKKLLRTKKKILNVTIEPYF